MFILFMLSFMMFQSGPILASAFNAAGKAVAEQGKLKQFKSNSMKDKISADHQGGSEIITRYGITANRTLYDRAEQKLKELEKSDVDLLCMLIQAAYYPDAVFNDSNLQENLQKQVTISSEFYASVEKNKTIAFTENYRKLIKALYIAKLASQ